MGFPCSCSAGPSPPEVGASEPTRVPAGLDPARLARPVRVLLGVVVVALGVAAVVSRASSFSPGDLLRNEFTQDYVSARAISDGVDPYGNARDLMGRYFPGQAAYVIRNPHPPLQIVLVRPLATLPYRGARAIWLLLQAAAFAGAIALVVRGFGWSRATAAVAGIAFLAIPVAQKELIYGNLNGALALLLALSWRALAVHRDRDAGIALGFAAAVKLFPIFMVIPLLRMRRGRSVAWMAVAAIAFTALGFAFARPAGLAGLRSSLADNATFWRAAPFNISLPAVAYRWLTVSIWHRGVANVPAVASVVALLLFAACAAGAATTPARRTGDVFWSAVPWMVLAVPLAWDWYLVLLLPTVVAVLATSARNGNALGIATLFGVALVAVGIPPGLPIPGQPISLAALVLGYGLATYGCLLLAAADAVPFIRRDRALVASGS